MQQAMQPVDRNEENHDPQKRRFFLLYVISAVAFLSIVLLIAATNFTLPVLTSSDNTRAENVEEAYQIRQAASTQIYLQTVNGFYIPSDIMFQLIGNDPEFIVKGGYGPSASVTFPDGVTQDAQLISFVNGDNPATLTLVYNETKEPVPYYNPDGTITQITEPTESTEVSK